MHGVKKCLQFRNTMAGGSEWATPCPVDRNLFFLRARLALGQNDRCKEEFEDTKGLIRIRIIEEEQTTQWSKEKEQTTIYKTYI